MSSREEWKKAVGHWPATSGYGCDYSVYERRKKERAKAAKEEKKRLAREKRMTDPPSEIGFIVVQSLRDKIEAEAARRKMSVSKFIRETMEKEVNYHAEDDTSRTNETASSND